MDNQTHKEKKPNPRKNANPLSAIMYIYMFPIFKRAFVKELKEDDLFEPLDEHKSSIIGEKLERIWTKEYEKYKKTALHRALLKCFGVEFFICSILRDIVEITYMLLMPYAIGNLVSYFNAGQVDLTKEDAYFYAGLIILMMVIDQFVTHSAIMCATHNAMKLRVSCCSLIYRKSLKLTRTALGNTTLGQLVNLLSNDVSKFDEGFVLAHCAWCAPIQAAIATYLLYREIGISAFIGIGFLLLFIPVQIYVGKRTSTLRLRTALRTDERVRLMNEIISGIQVIKMYTWEKSFAKLIAAVRRKEISYIRQHYYLIGVAFSFETFVTRTCIFLSFVTFVYLGRELTADKVFAVTAIYNTIRTMITILFSVAISSLAEINVSVNRIHKFLTYEELPPDVINEIKPVLLTNGNKCDNIISNCDKELSNNLNDVNSKDYNGDDDVPLIELKNVTAKWAGESQENTLKNIDINLKGPKLLAVIGEVGGGKSSLLNVILRELPVSEGTLTVKGKVSFSCQEPWLFIGTVRQNILFGSPYDEQRYKDVIKVCALEDDLILFPYGDKTLVGERGKALSGGQKARINLARCIYNEADIYLLDDPLSAVDTNVGRKLFDDLIVKYLNDKLRILITHQLQYLKSADEIIILNEGEIIGRGSFEELQRSGLDFGKLLAEFHTDDEQDKKKLKSRSNSEADDVDEHDEDAPEIEKEHMSSGEIGFKIYWDFMKAGGGYFAIFLLSTFYLLSQASANLADYFITYWVNLEEEHRSDVKLNLTTNDTLRRDVIIYEYGGITFTLIFFGVLHTLYFFVFFMRSSITLHEYIFSKISYGTMRFFNTNPSGRILNRFSKDLGIVDEYIPFIMFDMLECMMQLFGTFILTWVINPYLIPPSIFLLILFYFLRVIYIHTSRSVKRIEGVTRSPIFGQMTASLHGLSTIRAFHAQKMLIKEFDNYQDLHSSAWYLYLASNRAFGFWLDFFCIIFTSIVIMTLITFDKEMNSGDIGLIITQYIGLIGSLQWGMRQWSELENHMISVERVLEYTKVESEPIRDKIENLPKDWPEYGRMEFKDLSLTYNVGEPNVLKNLSFIVNSCEKIGIVGRTGAGKSSIITTLFQLYPTEGSIIIDNIDITKLPLELLRTKLSIIPQEPVLFSGTMRRNLDPFDEYTDDVLWKALEQVELKEVIAELPAGLNSNVSEGGSNFSVGQRQLVCLARAVIRSNKILVLDEATANVDPHTDALIQKTIRKEFSNCTVLTIAHRLHTVMDSDKILVMSAGCVVEYDHPHILLLNNRGYLYKMVEQLGHTGATNLKNIAEKSYYENVKNK